MQALKLKDAALRLDELVDKAAVGDEVVITRADGAAFKIIPVQMEEPTPTFGSAKGLIEIADDFDAPLEESFPQGSERALTLLHGSATSGMTTDEILDLTRGGE